MILEKSESLDFAPAKDVEQKHYLNLSMKDHFNFQFLW